MTVSSPDRGGPRTPRTVRDLLQFDRNRWRHVGLGALAGWLAGSLLVELGLPEILNWSTHTLLIVSSLGGALFGAIGLLPVAVVANVGLIAAYLVISSTPLMRHVAERWVRSDSLPKSADAIIVLSANANSAGMLNVHGVQRLLTGIELYQRGIAPRIFTTEVDPEYDGVIRSSVGDQRRLLQLGRAVDAWTSLPATHSTRDEAMKSAEQLPGGGHRVVVVTSPMHTRRACATFERVGFQVSCAPSREQEYVTWHPVTPGDRVAAFREYAYEQLGMLKYRIKGWLPQRSARSGPTG
jgi:uncharacterized SAM-binding protein YcdF (DUF218 family)